MMFRRKSDQFIEITRLSSLIDRGVEIVGDVIVTDGLRIDGRVQGDVRMKHDARALLVLSEHGSIEGAVRVYDAVINGTITGDVDVEHFIELQPNARVVGNIRYRQLRMECGAASRAGSSAAWRTPPRTTPRATWSTCRAPRGAARNPRPPVAVGQRPASLHKVRLSWLGPRPYPARNSDPGTAT
jgi:cytoskeletal protein CcmA (bactofilin family)